MRFPDNIVLYHDGLWGSAIWPWDGNPASLGHFDHEDRSIPFAALGPPPERLLIIGAAGGHEIQAAIHFGAKQIDAVELNPATAGLLRGPSPTTRATSPATPASTTWSGTAAASSPRATSATT